MQNKEVLGITAITFFLVLSLSTVSAFWPFDKFTGNVVESGSRPVITSVYPAENIIETLPNQVISLSFSADDSDKDMNHVWIQIWRAPNASNISNFVSVKEYNNPSGFYTGAPQGVSHVNSNLFVFSLSNPGTYYARFAVKDIGGSTLTEYWKNITVKSPAEIPTLAPNITSLISTASTVTRGSNIAFTGSANAGSSCIMGHRFYVVGSEGGAWTPVNCQQSISLNTVLNTSNNSRSFYSNVSSYVLRWEVQDNSNRITAKDILITLEAIPVPLNCIDSDGGINYTLAGYLSEGTVHLQGYYDYCLDSSNAVVASAGGAKYVYSGPTLQEFYCNSTGRFYVYYTCELGCSAGACITSRNAQQNNQAVQANQENSSRELELQQQIDYLQGQLDNSDEQQIPPQARDEIEKQIAELQQQISSPTSSNNQISSIGCANGCISPSSGICYPVGHRQGSWFCDSNTKTLVSQKATNSACNNSYECASNVCSSEKICIEARLFERALCRISTAFTRETYGECIANLD